MPPTPSKSLLTKKAGPLPVWGWGLAGLGLAYAYSRHQANKTAAAANTEQTVSSAGEPATGGQPYYVIENNLPPSSSPVTVNTGPPAPVVTPPGTQPTPPTQIQGANPPAKGGSGLPVPVTPTTPAPPVTAPKPPVTTPTSANPKPGTVSVIHYTVKQGDNLTKIAQAYGISEEHLWTYNTTPGNRSASDIATLKARGPNTIFPGETILVPYLNK